MLDSVEFVGKAAELGEEILDSAVSGADGTITWRRGYDLGFAPVPDAGMFSGRIGEAFLFAALADATHHDPFADAAVRAMLGLRRAVAAPGGPDSLAHQLGLGATGLGSIVYALNKSGSYLSSSRMIDEAASAVERLSIRTIEDTAHTDFTWGLAGWISSVLAAMERGNNESELLAGPALTLLRRRIVDERSQCQAWPSAGNGIPQSGFAHGNSGMAYALLLLHERTGIEEYYDAALEAFRFERTLYRPELHDWVESEQQSQIYLCSWCHGAPGIALARLACGRHMRPEDESDVSKDLSLSLHRTASLRNDTDTLCCGSFGRADSLLEAGIQLSNPSLIEAARAVVSDVVGRRHPSAYRISVARQTHMSGGMWQGLTGIAYELLRFADSGRYPSVLRLA